MDIKYILLTSLVAAVFGGISALIVSSWEGNQAEKAERYRQKFDAFKSLMSYRADYANAEFVKAVNLTDVLYADNDQVRKQWVLLIEQLNIDPKVYGKAWNFEVRDRIRMLLEHMAADLGLVDQLNADDFSRIYHPQLFEMQRQADTEELEARLRALQEGKSKTID